MDRGRNIKELLLQVKTKIKNFLLGKKGREFFVFMFFFFVASCFWLLQTLNSDYDKEFAIPVKLKNVPQEMVVTADNLNTLKVKVQDKGTVLLNYMLAKTFFPISLKFDDYTNKENHVKIVSKDLEKAIQVQFGTSTKILGISPDTLEYYYSKGVAKKVPVVLNGKISTEKTYYLADTVFSPDSVLVYAPEKMLKRINRVVTEPQNLSGVQDTMVVDVKLKNITGVKVVPDMVRMSLFTDVFTEKSVEVPVTGINFPSDKVLRTFPSRIKLTFQVGMKEYRYVTAEDFHITADYNELMNLNSSKFSVKVSMKPRGIKGIRLNPDHVDFLIEQKVAD